MMRMYHFNFNQLVYNFKIILTKNTKKAPFCKWNTLSYMYNLQPIYNIFTTYLHPNLLIVNILYFL